MRRIRTRDLTPELIREIRLKGKIHTATGQVVKLKQAELAEMCGVSRVTVARWENIKKPVYPNVAACRVLYDLLETIQRRSLQQGPARIFNQLEGYKRGRSTSY